MTCMIEENQRKRQWKISEKALIMENIRENFGRMRIQSKYDLSQKHQIGNR